MYTIRHLCTDFVFARLACVYLLNAIQKKVAYRTQETIMQMEFATFRREKLLTRQGGKTNSPRSSQPPIGPHSL